jgi:hypothetical protein
VYTSEQRNKYQRLWYSRHRAQEIARVTEYYRNHPEKKKKRMHTWLANHLEEHRLAARKYYCDNHLKICSQKKLKYHNKKLLWELQNVFKCLKNP